MSFKHGKFEDSATMRSYIRTASNKGWIESESLKKTASAEDDFSISENLTENVIKLCSGLRKSGMIKQAEELENKFFIYKKAEALYDVSGETGDDLVDAAHPNGSHKLENVDGPESVVETILEQHKKNLEVVNKKPTGKLASNKDILSAVKIALAQDVTYVMKQQYAINALKYFDGIINKADSLMKTYMPTDSNHLEVWKDLIADMNNFTVTSLNKDMSASNANKLKDKVEVLQRNFTNKGIWLDSQYGDKQWFKDVANALNQARGAAVYAMDIMSGMHDSYIASEEAKKEKAKVDAVQDQSNKLIETKKRLMNQLNKWVSMISDSQYSDKQKNAANKWLINQKNEVDMAETLDPLQRVSQENKRFYNAWVSKIKMNLA